MYCSVIYGSFGCEMSEVLPYFFINPFMFRLLARNLTAYSLNKREINLKKVVLSTYRKCYMGIFILSQLVGHFALYLYERDHLKRKDLVFHSFSLFQLPFPYVCNTIFFYLPNRREGEVIAEVKEKKIFVNMVTKWRVSREEGRETNVYFFS